MLKFFGWVVVAAIVYFWFQAGWFNGMIEYFTGATENAREEEVIEHEDGSITTVKYRNVFNLLFEK